MIEGSCLRSEVRYATDCARGPIAHGWVSSRVPWLELDDALPCFERGFPGAPPGIVEGP